MAWSRVSHDGQIEINLTQVDVICLHALQSTNYLVIDFYNLLLLLIIVFGVHLATKAIKL